MNFRWYVWRYDQQTTESERLFPSFASQEEAEAGKIELEKNDPDGLYSVQEGND